MKHAKFEAFSNPTDQNVEVLYTFPLPYGALLLAVEVQLGDQHLSGLVVEKKQAEARYEEAISEGDAAIMLEKNADHSYSLNLSNLDAQESGVITLRLAQTLPFEQGGLRLLIPTVIAPRYGDAEIDGGLQPHQVVQTSLLADYPFEIELHLHGDLRHARVASPSHPVSVAQPRGTSDALTVSLARRGALDRDFVLILDQLAHDSMVVLARDSVNADYVVALASFCPQIPEHESNPLAVKILVDCSGSMAGDSMDAAKRALQSIVQQLGTRDRFSLSRFGTTVEHRSPGLWLSTEATQLAAQRWIGNLQADLGGTEMNVALISTFRLAQTAPSDVLIVTDGEIDAIDRTIASAKLSKHRLFVVGIGSSPAESHLRRLAAATGGTCDFVAPGGEGVEPAILRMFARLRSPQLADVSVVWPDTVVPEWVSPLNKTIFSGDTVNVFALFKQAPVGEVCLQGVRSSDGPSEVIGCAHVGVAIETGYTLSKLTAFERLKSMPADGQSDALSASSQMAVDYQLVTEQTNFLMIHKRAEEDKPTDMPELHKVSHMVPAGWGGTGSVLAPRTKPRVAGKLQDLAMDSLPTVLRSSRRVNDNVESERFRGIPAFLRNTCSPIDRSNPRYWSVSPGYTGLTPLGLSEWLKGRPVDEWPTTYQELRTIGLGSSVIDWLELTMASHKKQSERRAVGTFVYVMSHPDIYDLLMKGLGMLQSFTGIAHWLKGLWAGKPKMDIGKIDRTLAEKMMISLHGIRADAWPEQVFSMESVEAADEGGCQ